MEIFSEHSKFRYVIFQEEKGEDNTKHYQGYAEFTAPLRLGSVKKILSRAHWEGRRGSQADAIAYCQKEDTRESGPYSCGIAGGKQGKRTDVDNACELLQSTRSIRVLAEEMPGVFVKFHRGFQRLLEVTVDPRKADPKCILLYGPTGTGKSHWAMNRFPDAYWKPPMSKWFDGYLDETTVIMDEFAGKMSQMTLTYLLRLMDKYPLKVEVKGSSREFLAETIVFTTNIHPYLWYDWEGRKSQWPALQRRFHEVWFLPTPHCTPIFLSKDSFFNHWHEGCDEVTTFAAVTRPNTPIQSEESEDDEAPLLDDINWDEDLADEIPFFVPPPRRVIPTRIGRAQPDAPLYMESLIDEATRIIEGQ